MASLSWLVFLIGVSTAVSEYFGFVIAVFAVVTIILTFMHLVMVFNPNDRDIVPVAERHGRSIRRWAIASWIGLFASIAIQLIVPSRQTAIMIAASEIRQQAVVLAQMQAKGSPLPALDPSIDVLNVYINGVIMDWQRAEKRRDDDQRQDDQLRKEDERRDKERKKDQ